MADKVLIVIPARYGAVRLPGKPLLNILGKPLIEWVYQQAKKVSEISEVWIATDDPRIQKKALEFGAKVLMTSAELSSGTERVEALSQEIDGDIYINLQGDEPLLEPEVIQKALELVRSGRFDVATAMTPLKSRDELLDPSVVKVVADSHHRALYFSRLPIPYGKKQPSEEVRSFISQKHIGLYVYRRKALRNWVRCPRSLLEEQEGLEQLRALEYGIPIGIVSVPSEAIGVDTEKDLHEVERRLSVGSLPLS